MPKFQLCDGGMNKQQFSGNRPNYHLTCVIQFICLLLYANMFSFIRLLLYANMSSLIRWKYKEDYVRSALQAQLCCLLAYLCKTMQESCSSSKLADIRQFQKDDIIRCFYPRVSSIDSLISSLLKLIMGWSRT